MDSFGKEELEYVIKSLNNGVRLDSRGIDCIRETLIEKDTCFIPDKSVIIRKGRSEIVVKIAFKSSYLSIIDANLPEEQSYFERCFGKGTSSIFKTNYNRGLDPDDYRTVETKIIIPNPVISILEEFLKKHKIGVSIEVEIRKNDGNLFDMIFEGLNHLFSSISIPNIDNLEATIETGINLPKSYSYAIFDCGIVADPTLIEEMAALSIVHVFKDPNDCNEIYFLNENPLEYSKYKSIMTLF